VTARTRARRWDDRIQSVESQDGPGLCSTFDRAADASEFVFEQ
jgi:hypothetical protein